MTTVTSTTVGNWTGVTYSASTVPTSDQVTSFISVAREIFEARIGSTPDEDEKDEAEWVTRCVENLIERYLWEKSIESGVTPLSDKPPVVDDEMVTLMDRISTDYTRQESRSFTVGI